MESIGGHLTIERLHSDHKPVFSTKSGGGLIVKHADVDKSFMYSEDGSLIFSELTGGSSAFVKGTAQLNMQKASQVQLVTEDAAKVLIGESNVNEALLLSSEQTSFIRSNLGSVNNKGKVALTDTQIDTIENKGETVFEGATTTGKISDSGKTTFKTGRHNVSEYRSSNSKLEVKGHESNAIADLGIVTENAVLMDNDAMVSIAKFRGMGSVDAGQQAYIQILPTFFHTNGDVNVFLDRMPKPIEIPLHDGGTFTLSVNMGEDYINTSNIDYGDVMISMDMQGHVWENREAAFLAGGLKVDRALHFGNTDGLIRLRKMLDVHAGKIFDIAHPIVRENGRWANCGGGFLGGGSRYSYYCPTTYYSANTHVGIEVTDGNVNLKSETDIVNRFSKICASGTLKASAKGNFDNIVGYIVALGSEESSIEAKNITNACLPAFLRQGEFYLHESGGGFLNSWSMTIHARTAELITQSHGSGILFGGDAKLDGHTRNFGSKIFTLGSLQGDVDSISLFENAARHGTLGTALEGEDLRFAFPSIFVHENLFSSKE